MEDLLIEPSLSEFADFVDSFPDATDFAIFLDGKPCIVTTSEIGNVESKSFHINSHVITICLITPPCMPQGGGVHIRNFN